MEVDAAIEKEVPLWKFSRLVWASFFWSQFFPSIFSFPWYIKDFLIAHTNFSVINYGFLIKVIICVSARSTVPTNTASETDVCLGELRSEGSMEFGVGWVGTEWWSGFSIEICGSLLMVYSTETTEKNRYLQRYMCLLRYFDRKYMMHTRASDSLMYNEMKNSEQEQNIILSIIWQQMLREMFAFITQSLLKTKQMAKSTLKVKMNDQLVNLSAQQDVNKTCGLVYAFNLFGFTFHTAFWVDNHNGTGETKSWQNDKEAAHSDSILYSVLQLEASSPIENYTLRKLSPCLSASECKHAESTNNCREKQRLLSIGRDAEEILNSYTNCKYKLLNGSPTTCVNRVHL